MSITDEVALKLITLNIEGDNHLFRVLPFLKQEQADVICLQEVLEKDVEMIKKSLQMKGLYLPFAWVKRSNTVRISSGTSWGLLFLTHLPVSFTIEYYKGDKDKKPIFHEEDPNDINRGIIIGEVRVQQTLFRIITTHFTWSNHGHTTQQQEDSLNVLLPLLSKYSDFILCGDFNAPRGREIWSRINEQYTDNIPSEVTTTVDSSLHKSGKQITFVVDGMFSTDYYSVKDVRVVSGVSDHKAIVGVITRKLDNQPTR